MRLFLLAALALLVAPLTEAASIETFTGDILQGKAELDFGGVLFHPVKGPVVKIDLGTIYCVQFNSVGSLDNYQPGVVLRNGVRLVAPWGPFNAPVIKFPHRGLTVPAEEIAWIVYGTFPAELAANVPGDQTGVLLPKGDFFAGTIKGADAEAAKVFNPIFGPRTFAAKDICALVLREAHVPPAQYEVRTADGSLFAADSLVSDQANVTIKHALYDNLVLSATEIVEIRAGANRCRPLATLGDMHADPPEGLAIIPDRGFTLETRSAANCVVPPGFTEFVAKVAPDETTPAGQHLVFSVLADGRPLARTTPMLVGAPPQDLRVAITGSHNLILRVDTPGQPGSETRGHWIQAFFLRR